MEKKVVNSLFFSVVLYDAKTKLSLSYIKFVSMEVT